jgi:acyl-CoA reductase-like NAD-dependent aldehyde dehydrogenase
MTHDVRAREVIANAFDDDDVEGQWGVAQDILTALTAAGLRVVPAEPSEADVERVAKAIWSADTPEPWENLSKGDRSDFLLEARAAIRAFLATAEADE